MAGLDPAIRSGGRPAKGKRRWRRMTGPMHQSSIPTQALPDVAQPFQIEGQPVRGRLVRLGSLVDSVLGRHDYPEPVATLLAEMLVLAAALSGSIKYDG